MVAFPTGEERSYRHDPNTRPPPPFAIIPAMKIYITGYWVRKEFIEAEKTGTPMPERDNYDIQFTMEPQWTFPTQDWAQTELNILNRMYVHKEGHYCQLELEKLAEDKYAIVCNDHPNISGGQNRAEA